MNKEEKQLWYILEDSPIKNWITILPSPDTKPHSRQAYKGFQKEDFVGKEFEISDLGCPCKPKIDWIDQKVIHNSFSDMDKVEVSMNNIIKWFVYFVKKK